MRTGIALASENKNNQAEEDDNDDDDEYRRAALARICATEPGVMLPLLLSSLYGTEKDTRLLLFDEEPRR